MRFNFLGIACKQIMQKSSSEEGSSGTFLGGRARLASVFAVCYLKGSAHLWGLFFTIFFLSEIVILPFQVFYIMLYGYWSIRENFFGKFWWHPAELWPTEWSTIFSLSARFLMFGWSETVNPYLFLKRAWMVIFPSKIVKIRL